MTATYTNQPGTRDIDTVRFETQDKDCDPETNAKLTDEEIQYLLDTERSVLHAAAAAADKIGATYATDPSSKMVGDLQLSYGDGKTGTYHDLAKWIRKRASRGAAAHVYGGGISKQDKETIAADSDRVEPSFTMGSNDSDMADEQDGVMKY